MSRLATSSTVTPVAVAQRPQVEDALVRDEAVLARVEHRVVLAQARRDVVRRRARPPRSRRAGPRTPIMRTYAHEIGRMPADPYGAAEIGPPSKTPPA